MPPIYRKEFTITGVANTTTEDTGLTSTEAETKRLVGMRLFVSGQIGNIIKGHLEREKILGLYDYHIDTDESSGSANVQKSVGKEQYFEINQDIPLGKTFKVGITCGATAKNVFGSYDYELV